MISARSERVWLHETIVRPVLVFVKSEMIFQYSYNYIDIEKISMESEFNLKQVLCLE